MIFNTHLFLGLCTWQTLHILLKRKHYVVYTISFHYSDSLIDFTVDFPKCSSPSDSEELGFCNREFPGAGNISGAGLTGLAIGLISGGNRH